MNWKRDLSALKKGSGFSYRLVHRINQVRLKGMNKGNVIKLSFSAQKGYSYWKFVTQKCL